MYSLVARLQHLMAGSSCWPRRAPLPASLIRRKGQRLPGARRVLYPLARRPALRWFLAGRPLFYVCLLCLAPSRPTADWPAACCRPPIAAVGRWRSPRLSPRHSRLSAELTLNRAPEQAASFAPAGSSDFLALSVFHSSRLVLLLLF